MNSPLISIVTVTLNCADAAVKTAESVMLQTYRNYQYLVKDGCSEDNTVEKLLEMGVTVHVSVDNGIYDAMNQAIALCSGQYICFLNAGDLFEDENVLENVAHEITSHLGPLIFFGDMKDQRVPGRIIKPPDILTNYFLFRNVICHQTQFVNLSLLKSAGGFDDSFRYLADYKFFTNAIHNEKVQYFHIRRVIVTMAYGGVSDMPSAWRSLQSERARIVKELFSKRERLVFGFFFFFRFVYIKHLLIHNKLFFKARTLYYSFFPSHSS